MSRCFFIGHREAEEALFPRIKEEAEKLIANHQVTEFYVGGYGNFDRLAGAAIIKLK